jgi:tetratricopeptide (TPR) repeat protein
MKELTKAAAILVLATAVLPNPARAGDETKWLEIHSAHFFVLTDGGEKRGREVALRMEQMRTVFGQLLMKDKLRMSLPVTVIALKSDKQYGLVAPTKQSMAQGFFVPGTDRIYIVLNLFEVEPWRAIAHPLAHYLLNYNYPPAQGWFDEGLAEYFGSLQVDNKQVSIGADPELAPEWHEDIFENVSRNPNVPQSLTQLLESPIWLSMVDLFSMKHDTSGGQEGTHHTLFYAQSWMVIHYLINKNKISETGTYFDLVLNQKVPIDKAMVQAFDLSPAQMEEAAKTYFKSLSGLGIALDRAKAPPKSDIPEPDLLQPHHFPTTVGPDDVALSVSAVPEPVAKAVLGDVMARVPEHRDQALHDLRQLVADPKDNEEAHRALAWDQIQQKHFDVAEEELDKASELNLRDPWIWYYRSVLKYRRAQATGQEVKGLANMMQDVREVIDWYPDLADAYNMLGMARVEGGGFNSALEAQRQAIALAPRNLEYQFNLGQIYVAGKKWDQARDLFTRLKTSSDPRAASAAKKQLADLDTLQKYGIRPQGGGQPAAPTGAASAPGVSGPGNTSGSAAATSSPAGVSSSSDDDEENAEEAAPKPAPARRAGPVSVQFLKGKLVSSDCSKSPEATLKVVAGMKTYEFHASDFKSLLVIGADQFSCDWKNRVVAINYRAAGKNAGEVVSIEVQ